MRLRISAVLLAASILLTASAASAAERVRITTFEADVTPPIGAPLCDGYVPPAKEVVDKLAARGVVILSKEKPIVLCALDWVGIGNGGYDAFREALAKAAGTTSERVAVHCLHQHDAPGCDYLANDLLAKHGLGGKEFDVAFARETMARTAAALEDSLKTPRSVTHVGIGKSKVEQVASARRVMGPDDKVKVIRWSSNKDAAVRDEPEGVIDPYVQLLAFFDGDTPIATLTYYATHPQSYYGQGGVTCDFPGLARGIRDRELPGVFHVHFNGAGGNVTAGKYNDGSPEMRPILAQRLAAGMKSAGEDVQKIEIKPADVHWLVRPVALPPAPHLDIEKLKLVVADEQSQVVTRLKAARDLAWAGRCAAGDKIDLTCLRLGPVAVLHMPGELFVEYQLAAQAMRPGTPVLMAAYGDYGPGYIGLKRSYSEGGYETGPVSRTAPEVEDVLMAAMRELLK